MLFSGKCRFTSGKKIMKRILFITKNLTLGGGAEKHIVDLANGLCEKGHSIAILVFDLKGGKGARAEDINPEIEIISARSNYVRPFFLRGAYEMAMAISKWKPDVLCSMTWSTKPIAAVAGRLLKTKVVLVASNNPLLELSYGLPKRWRIWPKSFALFYRKRIYSLADVVVAVSRGVGRGTKELFQLNEVKTVHNGIDIDEVVEKSKTADTFPHAHKYFHDNCPVLVATGRMHIQKGYPYLLEALRIVNETAEARLIIIGDGKLKDKLLLKAESLGISEKVDMVGKKVPYAYMRHADIFVLSSLWEGLPLVLLEAISLGMPVVSTDCDYGPNEVIENEKSGLLVPVADPPKLASAILRLIKDEKLRANLATEAKKRSRYFSSHRMVSGYEEIFVNL